MHILKAVAMAFLLAAILACETKTFPEATETGTETALAPKVSQAEPTPVSTETRRQTTPAATSREKDATPEPTENPEASMAWRQTIVAPYEALPPGHPNEVETPAIIVHRKYKDLLWRQPNVWSTSVGFLIDRYGRYTGETGIIVSVTRKVPQEQLPPEDRIPKELDGIPVQIVQEPYNPRLDVKTGSEKDAIPVPANPEDSFSWRQTMVAPDRAYPPGHPDEIRTLAKIAIKKYHDLLWRQPNVWSIVASEIGIVVNVVLKISQEQLPSEDRIPEKLDGIPVEIREELPLIANEDNRTRQMSASEWAERMGKPLILPDPNRK